MAAEDKIKLYGDLPQYLEEYLGTADSIKHLYDQLESMVMSPLGVASYPNKTVADLSFSTERRKVRDILSEVYEILANEGGTASTITGLCGQIKQVNQSLNYIKQESADDKLLAATLQGISIDIDQLIADGKLLVDKLEKFVKEAGKLDWLPKKPSDWVSGYLHNASPQAVPFIDAAKWAANRFGLFQGGQKSAASVVGGKYKPTFSSSKTASPKQNYSVTSLGEMLKSETGGSFSVASPEQAPTSIQEKSAPTSTQAPTSIQEKSAPTSTQAPTSIQEKSASPTDISRTVEKGKSKNESFIRQGKPYQPERNEKGQFTGGGYKKDLLAIESESPKNRIIAEETEQKDFHEGLYKFFSKTAYEAKWTAELLEAVKGKPSGDGKAPSSSGGIGVGKFLGPVLAVLAAGAAGAALGTFINEKLGLGKVIQGAIGDHVEKSALAKDAAGSGDPVTKRSLELQAKGMSFKEAETEAIKEKGTDAQKAQWAKSSETIGKSSVKPTVPGKTDSNTKPSLDKVPIVSQGIAQSGNKPELDKLYAVMVEISTYLQNLGKATSTKKPSGYDANNTRNPVLSSLGAGQLDIS